jgi:biopolymer transport protein ExbD
MIRHRKRTADLQEPPINLTPLIDVVFVVLIAFIMVAPLLERDQVQLASSGHSPTHEPVSMKDNSPIQIHVKADNSVLFCGASVDIPLLTDRLIQSRKQFPNAHVQVFHDKRAQFGAYQAVKNCVENAGFGEMDIVLMPS